MFFLKQLKQLKNQKQDLIILVLTKQAPTDLKSNFKVISVILKKMVSGSYKHTLNTTLQLYHHAFLTTSSHVICLRGFFLPFAFPPLPPKFFPPPPRRRQQKKKKQKKIGPLRGHLILPTPPSPSEG